MSVQIRELIFRWPGQQNPLLVCESLDIERGEKVFLQGASGSGKTTFLGLLGGVLTPEAGSISVLGMPVNRMKGASRDRFRADHIGFIFQLFNLLPYLSVLDNVLLALKFSARKRKKVACQPQKEALRLLESLGLQDKFNKGVQELSVGQQQRVAVARALIGRPELVIADEPTSALDADARGAFMELLFEEVSRAGSTLIYVSHDPEVSSRFDQHLSVSQFHPTHV